VPLETEHIKVVYIRSSSRLQEWRSEFTGRHFEVHELDSYKSTDLLQLGDVGYVQYSGLKATIKRFPIINKRKGKLK
jgi:DNA replication protein DnaC